MAEYENSKLDDWALFYSERTTENASAFTFYSSGVLRVVSSSTTNRCTLGASFLARGGDVLEFEADAYVASGEAVVNVKLGDFLDTEQNYQGSNARSLVRIPAGEGWKHYAVKYRVPFGVSAQGALALVGFAQDKTGTAYFKNPKVLVNGTQIMSAANGLVSFDSATYTYYTAICDRSLDISSDYAHAKITGTSGSYDYQNIARMPVGDGIPRFKVIEGSLGLAKYNATASQPGAKIVMASSKAGTIGNHAATVEGTMLGRVEFFGDSGSDWALGARIFAQQTASNVSLGTYVPASVIVSQADRDGSYAASLRIWGTTRAVTPGADNVQTLGSAGNRWSVVHAGSGSISTSDIRAKDNLEAPSDALMRAWGKVGFKVFQMRDAIGKKGVDEARLHVGVVAQEVQAAFSSEGLDASRYGLFCYDEWEDEYETVLVVDAEESVDPDTGETVPAVTHEERRLVRPAGSRYGIRYEEALALECAYQRWRLEQIEARLNEISGNSPAPSGASSNNL